MTVKIRFQMHIVILIALFISISTCTIAQDRILNKYGLWVIKNIKTLKKTIDTKPANSIIDVKDIPGIVLDLRYATINNFMNKKLYKNVNTAYLRMPAATALILVQKELQKQNFGLKIFDAYRPYSVTEKMWEPFKDERYVADPKKGSGHNRGVAVDLTIIDMLKKQELDMGTGFDNFSDTAHHNFTSLPSQIVQNRMLLKSLMEKYGFKSLDSEWWHYSLPNAKDYELLDISFKQIKKIIGKKN